MSWLSFRARLFATSTAIALGIAGCSNESPQEMLQRALSDTSMSDAEAVELAAKAIFDGAEISTESGNDGKVLATVSVHGVDESGFPPSVIDTAQGGVNNAMKKIQLIMFVDPFARFVEQGRQRNLGEVVLTIKTPTFSEGQIHDWVDTYRLRLADGQFDDFLQIIELDLDKQVAAAEKIWTVEFDGFNQFTYQK